MDEKEQPRDEFLEAEVERALKPYRGLLGKTALEALEATVRDILENDPVAVELLQAARPRATAPTTGDREVDGAAPEPEEQPSGKGGR